MPVSTENEKDYNLQNEDQSILKFLQINYIFKIFSNLTAIDLENMEKEKRGILIGILTIFSLKIWLCRY